MNVYEFLQYFCLRGIRGNLQNVFSNCGIYKVRFRPGKVVCVPWQGYIIDEGLIPDDVWIQAHMPKTKFRDYTGIIGGDIGVI